MRALNSDERLVKKNDPGEVESLVTRIVPVNLSHAGTERYARMKAA